MSLADDFREQWAFARDLAVSDTLDSWDVEGPVAYPLDAERQTAMFLALYDVLADQIRTLESRGVEMDDIRATLVNVKTEWNEDRDFPKVVPVLSLVWAAVVAWANDLAGTNG